MSTEITGGYENIKFSRNRTTRFLFDSTEERDKVINKLWPKRECMDSPGSYELPDGNYLGVYMNEVTLYEDSDKANCLILMED